MFPNNDQSSRLKVITLTVVLYIALNKLPEDVYTHMHIGCLKINWHNDKITIH